VRVEVPPKPSFLPIIQYIPALTRPIKSTHGFSQYL
jgi:hypothetical protein